MTAARQTPPRKVVLFGAGGLARLACYCLRHDSVQEVAGFTVDGAHLPAAGLPAGTLHDLPVVAFEDLERHFSPRDHDLLIAVGPHEVNRLRARRFEEGRARGYRFASYISSRANLWPDLEIGEGCMIFENAVVEPFSRIGDNAILRANVHVSHDGVVGDHVFLAPRVAMAGTCGVEQRSFVGVNATLRDGVTVAADCVVGAGAVVARSTEAGGLYVGVPAKRVGSAGDVKVWP
jgi:sugar O-acyltransferase (sialic acid O-acetyltransferase NeuD family)